MDRRLFFKKMLYTPLVTPLLLKAPSYGHLELVVLSESPESVLAPILKEWEPPLSPLGKNVFCSPSHPRKIALIRRLSRSGWQITGSHSNANLILSSQKLHKAALPSFTLVKNGQIVDIRSRKLYSLWKEIYRNGPPSNLVTSAVIRRSPAGFSAGHSASVTIAGRAVDEIPLNTKDSVLSYSSPKGQILVSVEKGKVRVAESTCRHKICTCTSPISFGGERIICAPNHFMVKINGPSPFDTVIG